MGSLTDLPSVDQLEDESLPSVDQLEEETAPKKTTAFDYYVKQPLKWGVEQYTHLARKINPEQLLGVAPEQVQGPHFYPDEKTTKKFERDIPGVDYTLQPQGVFEQYVMPPQASEKGIQPPPLSEPIPETITGAQLALSKGYGFPWAKKEEEAYRSLGIEPQENAVSSALGNLVGYGTELELANKGLGKVAPYWEALSKVSTPAKIMKDVALFGGVEAARGTMEGGSPKEVIERARNAMLLAPIFSLIGGGKTGVKPGWSESVPEGLIAEDLAKMPGIQRPPTPQEPPLSWDTYRGPGEPIPPPGTALGPFPERATPYPANETYLGKKTKPETLYSIGPQMFNQEKGPFGWIKKALTGQMRTMDLPRGFDPAEGPMSKFEHFVRKYFGLPGSELPLAQSERRRMFMDFLGGKEDFAGEIQGVMSKLTPEQRRLLFQLSEGTKKMSDPEYAQQVAEAGIPQHAIDVAQMARGQSNELQRELFHRGILSEQQYNAQREQYLKRLYDTQRRQGRGGGAGGVGRIISRKELSPEWRAEHQIVEAGLPESVTLRQDAMRVGMARYVDETAKDAFSTLTEDTVRNQIGDVPLAERPPRINVDGFPYRLVEGVPEEELSMAMRGPQQAQARAFGMRGLQGKYVYEPILDDLETMFGGPQRMGDLGQKLKDFWTRARSLWKTGKAAVNPANTVGNGIGNVMLMDFAMPEASPWTPKGWDLVKKAWQDLSQKTPMYREAQLGNTFGGRAMREDIRVLESAYQGEPPSNFDELMNRMEWLSHKQSLHYGVMEKLSKMAIYRYGIEVEGMNPQQASRYARKWIFDYQDIPRFIRGARQVPFGPAFITFPYKMVPRMAEAALNLEHPTKFWKYPAALMAIEEEAKRRNGISDEQVEAWKKMLPEWSSRFMVFVGMHTNEKGKEEPMLVDPRYVMPYMDVMGSRNETPIWQTMTSGGPEAALGELIFNKKLYSGAPIIRPKDTTLKAKAGQVGKHLFRAWAPQAVVKAADLYQAVSGEKDRFGRPKRELYKEIPSLLSAKIVTPDPLQSALQKRSTAYELKDSLDSIGRDSSLSPEEKQDRIRAAMENFQDAMQ